MCASGYAQKGGARLRDSASPARVDTEGLTLSHSCPRSPLECWDLLPSALSRPAWAALGHRRWGQESTDRPLPAPQDCPGWLPSQHLTPGGGCREHPCPLQAVCTHREASRGSSGCCPLCRGERRARASPPPRTPPALPERHPLGSGLEIQPYWGLAPLEAPYKVTLEAGASGWPGRKQFSIL